MSGEKQPGPPGQQPEPGEHLILGFAVDPREQVDVADVKFDVGRMTGKRRTFSIGVDGAIGMKEGDTILMRHEGNVFMVKRVIRPPEKTEES